MTVEDFWAALQNMPAPKPVFWRLYYDAEGKPIQYTMEDLPGTYIDVDPITYSRGNMNVRVKDGQLIEVFFRTTKKLVPDNSDNYSNTTTNCHPNNVAVVVAEDQTHTKWRRKTYESN
jgi:hypothetical protein